MRCMERYELVCRGRAWRQQDICKLESLHASVRCMERAELHTDEGPNVFQVRSRIQLSQDDVVAIFFSFDEAGKGYIAPWDLEKMANINDFIWTDFELSKMIHCFDSDKDGKVCPLFLNKNVDISTLHYALFRVQFCDLGNCK
ncbi:calcium-dependent protein kinase 27-like [Hordeum vulgare]|nr:calcium-dependent protein kinase 27-like [Hordeum vulgare]